MQVEEYLNDIVEREGTVHLTLLDPASQSPDEAGEIALAVTEGGTDAIIVGGSTGAGGVLLDQTLLKIKEQTDKPTILFPGNASGVSVHADAIFFMILLNSRDVNYITASSLDVLIDPVVSFKITTSLITKVYDAANNWKMCVLNNEN